MTIFGQDSWKIDGPKEPIDSLGPWVFGWSAVNQRPA